MPHWMSVQVSVLHFLQSVRGTPLDAVAVWLSWLGNYPSYMGIIAFALWMWGAEAALSASLAAVSGALLTDALKEWTALPRPIGRPGVRSLYIASAGGTSFPSGHALVATAVFVILASYAGRVGAGRERSLWRGDSVKWLLLAVPVLGGLSRLYLGVHWPTDVLAGWIIGYTLSRLVALRPLREAAPWLLLCAVLWMSPLPSYTRQTVSFAAMLWAVWPFARMDPDGGAGLDGGARGMGYLTAWLFSRMGVWLRQPAGGLGFYARRRFLLAGGLLAGFGALARLTAVNAESAAWWAPLALAVFVAVTGRWLERAVRVEEQRSGP